MQVSILGTEYEIIMKKYDEEPAFERVGICGYCDSMVGKIVVCDMRTYKGWEHEEENTIIAAQKETLRHEIVHAFLNESGLSCSTSRNDDRGWSKNEEMVDWMALQFPKMVKVFYDAGCLDLNIKFETEIPQMPTENVTVPSVEGEIKTVYINGRIYEFDCKTLDYSQIIRCVTGGPCKCTEEKYTVTYANKYFNIKGIMHKHCSVELMDGMIFNATLTNNN